MQGVDPVGACAGPRGSRVRMVVSELRGERSTSSPGTRSPHASSRRRSRRARARGLHRRRDARGDRHRPERPAGARDREGGAERPPRDAAHRLDDRHPVRAGVRAGRGRARLRGLRGGEESRDAARRSSPTASAARTRRLPGSHYCGVPAHQALASSEPAEAVVEEVAPAQPEAEAPEAELEAVGATEEQAEPTADDTGEHA